MRWTLAAAPLTAAMLAAALLALAGCVAEFPAEAPEPLPDPDVEMQEPEPDGQAPDPEPDVGPAVDMAPPEVDLGPQPETCNGIDDDFDGITDEDFALNQPCVDGGGLCGLTACAAGGAEAECVAGAGAVMQGDEVCNAVDDDCDGNVDEGFDVAAECTVGQGICQNFGLEVCTDDGAGTTCDAAPLASEDEFCNELDDDCDGSVDEGGVCE